MTCGWPIDRRCLPAAESLPDQVKQQHAEDLAVSVLWALSGRQFGICPVIARPCPGECTSVTWNGMSIPPVIGFQFPGWIPVWDQGQWRNITCGCATQQCTAAGPSVVHLPGPATGITEVTIGAVPLDPSGYSLEGDLLYRTGGGSWPRQDLTRPLGEEGTWSVTYLKGRPVPDGADVLAGILALEFLNACTGGKCRLPRRVENVTRQGVSYQMIDPVPLLDSGWTGIPEIDMWLRAVNPHHILAAPKVR